MQKLNLMPLVIRLSYVGMLLSLPLAASAVDNPLIKGYCGPPPPNSWFQFSSSTYADVKAHLISTLTQHAFADYPAAVSRWFASNGGATHQGIGCQIQLHASDPLPPITYCPDLSTCVVQLNGYAWSTCGSAESAHMLNTFVQDYGGCYFGYATAPEQYTVALQGLNVTLMPGQTLSSAYAQVTTSSGAPKSGAQISLRDEVFPDDYGMGGSSQGSLFPSAGSTDGSGQFSFQFTAPLDAGNHVITASCSNCTNSAQGIIKVPGCPVQGLTPLDLLSKSNSETPEQAALTQQLEQKIDGYSLLSNATKSAEQCLAGRIQSVLGDPAQSGYQVTSTVRTLAYQAHLREVWDKFFELQGKVAGDPSLKQRCAVLITKVEGEMGFHLNQDPTDDQQHCDFTLYPDHCIVQRPARTDPKHVKNVAFDIHLDTVTDFQDSLTSPNTVETEANACSLTWGGTFNPKDEVHFVLK